MLKSQKSMLPINQLTLGMVVAEDVKDRSGRLLLATDRVLTEKHMKVLRAWGVKSVSVYAQDEDVPHDQHSEPKITIVAPDIADKYCEKKFAATNIDFEPVQRLKNIVLNRIIEGKQEIPCHLK